MFKIIELPRTRIGEARTLAGARAALDAECRRRHDQAVANGEGAHEITYRFVICDPTGEQVERLIYSPDPSRLYESFITEDSLREGQP